MRQKLCESKILYAYMKYIFPFLSAAFKIFSSMKLYNFNSQYRSIINEFISSYLSITIKFTFCNTYSTRESRNVEEIEIFNNEMYLQFSLKIFI